MTVPSSSLVPSPVLALNLQLKNSTSVFELERTILNANADDFNMINCTTAIQLLGSKQSKNSRAIGTVLNLSQRCSFDARGLATFCYGIAQGKLLPRIPQFLLDRLDASDLREFNALDISNTMWSFATLSQPLPAKLTGKLASGDVSRNWSSFSPQGIANLFWSIAQLGEQERGNGGELIAVLRAGIKHLSTRPNFADFTMQGLCNIVWALAKTGEGRLEPDLVSKLCKEMLARQQQQQQGKPAASFQFCGQDVANTFWALSTLSHPDFSQLVQEFTRAMHLVDNPQVLAQFKPQELTNTVWALANMQYAGDLALLQALERALLKNSVESLSPHSLASTLGSFAKLDFSSLLLCEKYVRYGWRLGQAWQPQDLSTFIWALARNNHPIPFWLLCKLQDFHLYSNQSLTNILWGMARMGVRSNVEVLDGIAQQLLQRVGGEESNALDTKSWLVCLGSLSALGFMPPLAMLDRELDWKSMSLMDLSMIAASFANLNHRNERIVAAIAGEVVQRWRQYSHNDDGGGASEFSSFDPCLLMWSFASLNALRIKEVDEFFQLEPPAGNGLVAWSFNHTMQNAHQLMQTKLAWEQQCAVRSALLDAVGAGNWFDVMVHQSLGEKLPSFTQLKIFGMLTRHLEDNVSLLHETSVCGLSVDMLIESMRCVIEVDGVTHYLIDGKTLNGASLLKRRLLQVAGYKVYSIKVSEFRRMNEASKSTYIRNLVRQIYQGGIEEATRPFS